jgi:hypothetical protein
VIGRLARSRSSRWVAPRCASQLSRNVPFRAEQAAKIGVGIAARFLYGPTRARCRVALAAFTGGFGRRMTCTKKRISAVLSSRFYLSRCRAKNIPLGAHPKSVASCSYPASCRGAYRDRHGRGGGERWPRVVAAFFFGCGRTIALRTAKPCGPDAPTLAPSLRRRSRVSQVTGQESPVPGY